MANEEVRYPNVVVQLSGEDGNTGSIMGRIARELRRSGVSSEEIDEFRMEMLSGDYDNVLRTAVRWVTVE